MTAREDTASEQWPTRPIGGVDDPLCTIGNDDIPRNGDAVFVWRCVLSSLQVNGVVRRGGRDRTCRYDR